MIMHIIASTGMLTHITSHNMKSIGTTQRAVECKSLGAKNGDTAILKVRGAPLSVHDTPQTPHLYVQYYYYKACSSTCILLLS